MAVERDPFILRSEHLRILGAAQARYDGALKHAQFAAFWKGVGHTLTYVILAVYFGFITLFALGVI